MLNSERLYLKNPEATLPTERLKSEANRLINTLKTAIYNIPEFQANPTEKLPDDKEISEATIFNKDGVEYVVSCQKGKSGNNLAVYENIAIAAVTKSEQHIDKCTYIRVYTHKNDLTGNTELAHISYTKPSTSGEEPEIKQKDNQIAVDKIEEFMANLIPSNS